MAIVRLACKVRERKARFSFQNQIRFDESGTFIGCTRRVATSGNVTLDILTEVGSRWRYRTTVYWVRSRAWVRCG